MKKDSFYFQHDYNSRNDEKILELRANFGSEGYGIFWMLLESMAETQDGKLNLSLIGGLSLGYGVAKEKLKEIIEFCINVDLFEQELQFFYSNRMIEHKGFRQVLSEGGKAGAKARWEKERLKEKEAVSKNHFEDIKKQFALPYIAQLPGFKEMYNEKEYQEFVKFLSIMLKEFQPELELKFDKCLSIGDWKKYLKSSGYMVVKPFIIKVIGATDGDRKNMAARIATYSNGIFDVKTFNR